MNRAMKKILPLVMALVLVLGMFTLAPMTAYAATAQPVPSGAAVTISTPGLYNIATADNGATITVTVNGVALTGTHGNLSVVISAGITLTLKDASITKTGSGTPVQAGGMGCVLILVGDNSVTGAPSSAGVNVPDTASLTIEGPGKLTARGGQYGAGIGDDDSQSSGAITIRHATVAAYGGARGGAGIGGGNGGNGSNINIINSSVTATGGASSSGGTGGGAGIGGGGGGAGIGGIGESITIAGSAVVAHGGEGSYTSSSGTLGNGGGGAGIGGGGGSSSVSGNYEGGNGSNITIDAFSSVQANGGGGGSGGGGGGGAGAAVGGGGGGGAGGSATRAGGSGTSISIAGDKLAFNSAGGAGGTSTSSGGNGGGGALCGAGGSGGEQGGGAGATGTELGGVTATGPAVDLSSRPDSGYTGYPALPAVTGPSNQTVTAGGNASFTVSPSGGTAPLVSQWQLSTDSGASWGDISGATTSTLTLTNVQLADNGKQYRCVVNDSVWREAVSGAATLTVNPAPVAPTITGPTSMTLTAGYAATSTTAYTVTGNPAPTVSASGNLAITWNNATQTLDIAAGLAAGTYPVVLTASNGVGLDATLTFTLTVSAPNVTFTSSPSSINLGNPTNLVFRADAPALLSGYSFEGVAFQNVTAGTGFGMALGSSQGVTYNPATGVLTVPAAAFGQHVSVGGGSPLTPGNYRAQIQFWDGVSNYFDYYVDFVMTDSGPPKPPSPLPKTGDGFPLYALLALLGAALAGMGWLGARLRNGGLIR